MSVFTEKIQILMKAEGITAKKLTENVGLSSSAISEWKKGKAKPSYEAIVKIAQYFNVSTDYLLRDDFETPVSQHDLTENEVSLVNDHKDDPTDLNKTKAAPGGEQPLSEKDLDIAQRIMSLSPENQVRVLDYLGLLEQQDKS
jgi:transcriptional regulator with XRE-family HTH domain